MLGNFVPSLLILDGAPIIQRRKMQKLKKNSYSSVFDERRHSKQGHVSSGSTMTVPERSLIDHTFYDGSADGVGIFDEVDEEEEEEDVKVVNSTLPWRNPV